VAKPIYKSIEPIASDNDFELESSVLETNNTSLGEANTIPPGMRLSYCYFDQNSKLVFRKKHVLVPLAPETDKTNSRGVSTIPPTSTYRPAQAAKLVFLSLPALESARPAQAAKPDPEPAKPALLSLKQPKSAKPTIESVKPVFTIADVSAGASEFTITILLWWAQKCWESLWSRSLPLERAH